MTALRRSRQNITRVVAALLVAAGVAAVALPADAARKPSVYGSPLLWATVNACDTDDKPDTIGVRASMPGSGVARERMFVRLRVEYLDRRSDEWLDVGRGGDSGWLELGSGRATSRQAGTDFRLRPPAGGGVVELRGAVTYEWRRGETVVRRARKRTESSHPGTRGSDPPGFSAATCALR